MTDALFGPAFLDADEWRDEPIRHRYVHGGFEGTNTRFEIRFPSDDVYKGRMIQFLGGGAGGSETGAGNVGLLMAASNGAYLVESNQGFRGSQDPVPEDLTILGYRANAQTARYSAQLAKEHYGRAPDHKYLFGISGGGNRSVNAMEHTHGVYDGAVAFGIVIENLAWESWSVWATADPLLRESIPALVDATDPGGTGDPIAALETQEQRNALAALYKAGFPYGAEFLLATSAGIGWGYVTWADPTYLTDFWETPGYAGCDGEVRRVQGTGTALEVFTPPELVGRAGLPPDVEQPPMAEWVSDAPAGVRLRTDVPAADLVGAHARTSSGREFLVTAARGDMVFPQKLFTQPGTVQAGDEVTIDNGAWLAWKHYHRYAKQRRDTVSAETAAALGYTGTFDGKLIVVEAALDHMAFTTSGHRYAQQVTAPERFRLWWMENADHGPPMTVRQSARLINFWGIFHQSVRDLIAWVEDGAEPAPSTGYSVGDDGILRLDGSGGIQPVVSLRGGTARAGEPIALDGAADVPPGTGSVAEVAWDFCGTGDWATGELSAKHAYAEPGTYFPGMRVRSHRDGPGGDPKHFIENIARARVVVS